MLWYEVTLSHFCPPPQKKEKTQINLTWVQFFVVVELLVRPIMVSVVLFLEARTISLQCAPFYLGGNGKDRFISSCQCWGVSCLCSVFPTVDITGLYKVIMRAKRWIFLQKCPRCLCAKLTLRDSRHFRGRGNTGAISAQAPSGGTGN